MWVAGPAAGGVLADWGADVIKVETPVGDPMRRLLPAARRARPARVAAVRPRQPRQAQRRRRPGRRPRAAEIVRRLVARRRRVPHQPAPRGGRAARPRPRRRCWPSTRGSSTPSVTGYGLEGPDVGRAGYDVGAFWARSGIAVADGARRHRPARRPVRHGRPRHRHHDGGRHPRRRCSSGSAPAQGQLVEASLLRTGIYCRRVGPRHPDALRQDRLGPAPHDRDEPDVQLLRGRRRALVLAARRRGRPALAEAAARPSTGPTCSTDERFSTARGRRHERGRADRRCSTRCSPTLRPATSSTARFDAHDVWWAPVNTPAEVLADPQAIAAGAFVDVPEGAGAPAHRAVATPITFHGRATPAGRCRCRAWASTPTRCCTEPASTAPTSSGSARPAPSPDPRLRRGDGSVELAQHVVHLERGTGAARRGAAARATPAWPRRRSVSRAAGDARRRGRPPSPRARPRPARCTSSTVEWCLSCRRSARSEMVGAVGRRPTP